MITSTIRYAKPDEKQRQREMLLSPSERWERFAMKLVVAVLVLITPLLVYDHHHPVSSEIQAGVSAIVVVLSVFLSRLWTKRAEGRGGHRGKRADTDNTPVEVVQVKTGRVFKRADPEDFGVAYYVDVTDCGQRKTLYLWGQYLDDLEYEKRFPNTAFEFVRQAGSDEFITFETTGHYFEAEKTLPALDKAAWRSGNYPLNGQLLNQTPDTISDAGSG